MPVAEEPMRNSNTAFAAILLVLASLLSACASAPPVATATVIRTLHEPSASDAAFSNVVVIGVAGDYATRSSFEDSLGQAIGSDKAMATPWYAVVGRRPALTRDGLLTAIRARIFDAVILTRQKGQESRGDAAGRPVGRAFQLFEYDYPQLNVPSPIEHTKTIEFVTEVWRTSDFRKIWSVETLSFDKTSAQALIDEQSATIAQLLLGDGVVAN